MPMIVETPDDHLMVDDELQLLGPNRIVFLLEQVGLVLMAVKRRLMSDDQIFAFGLRSFQDVEGGHHGRGNSRHRRIRIPGLNGVDGLFAPGDADVRLDLIDDLMRGRGRLGGGQAGKNEDE